MSKALVVTRKLIVIKLLSRYDYYTLEFLNDLKIEFINQTSHQPNCSFGLFLELGKENNKKDMYSA